MARTIDIPGGSAVLYDKQTEINPRRKREIEIVSARLGQLTDGITQAGRLLCEGDVIDDRTDKLNEDGTRKFPGPDLDLTEDQLRTMFRLNDVIAWALLDSWTLDRPLPKSPTEMLDIEPPEVYEALRQAAGEINAAMDTGGFTADDPAVRPADGEPDTSLPFTGSAGSPEPSAEISEPGSTL